MSSSVGSVAVASRGDGLPSEALVFMQNKLEGIYKRTFKFLSPWKDWIEEAEHVLVWDKPVVSASLYIAVHWAFV